LDRSGLEALRKSFLHGEILAMKMMPGLVACALVTGWHLSLEAAPGDLPFRVASAAASKASGLQGRAVVHLTRLKGAGRDVGLERVLAEVAEVSNLASGGADISYSDGRTCAMGAGWMLEVRGSGEWVRFRHDEYFRRDDARLIPREEMPPVSDLVARAREFLRSGLKSFVLLGPGEGLEAWSADFLVGSAFDSAGIHESGVSASRVIFTRAVDQIPVLGPGSKASIIMSPDGEVIGFDFDWPALKRSSAKFKTVGVDVIRNRHVAVMRDELGLSAPPTERSFECGYYDPGVGAGDSGRALAPACVVAHPIEGGFDRLLVVPISENGG